MCILWTGLSPTGKLTQAGQNCTAAALRWSCPGATKTIQRWLQMPCRVSDLVLAQPPGQRGWGGGGSTLAISKDSAACSFLSELVAYSPWLASEYSPQPFSSSIQSRIPSSWGEPAPPPPLLEFVIGPTGLHKLIGYRKHSDWSSILREGMEQKSRVSMTGRRGSTLAQLWVDLQVLSDGDTHSQSKGMPSPASTAGKEPSIC